MSTEPTIKQRILEILARENKPLTSTELTKRINAQTKSTYYDQTYVDGGTVSFQLTQLLKDNKLEIIQNFGPRGGAGYQLPSFDQYVLNILQRGTMLSTRQIRAELFLNKYWSISLDPNTIRRILNRLKKSNKINAYPGLGSHGATLYQIHRGETV